MRYIFMYSLNTTTKRFRKIHETDKSLAIDSRKNINCAAYSTIRYEYLKKGTLPHQVFLYQLKIKKKLMRFGFVPKRIYGKKN